MTSKKVSQFFNRELSWLEFNYRVLEEALDETNPLLERLKFFTIFSSNLDEFFEVRVAGLKQQIESDVVERSSDGRTATETYLDVSRRVRGMLSLHRKCWKDQIHPNLEKSGIHFHQISQLKKSDLKFVDDFYWNEARPVLTPLGIDPAHPFPHIHNKALNLIIRLQTPGQQSGFEERLAVLQIPQNLPRLLKLPTRRGRRDFVFLGEIIQHYLEDLFQGSTAKGAWQFRVTRNSELYIDEDDAINMLRAVEEELHNRRRGDAVRLEVEHDCPAEIREMLRDTMGLETEDVYEVYRPLNPVRLMSIYEGDHSPELRDPPFVAPVSPSVQKIKDLYSVIRKKDLMLHHPYESFSTVVDFLNTAADDPRTLAIKQTLYRTGGDTRIVGALMRAARKGVQVTAVVELKARFDEANNIHWARRMEEAGVHVVYGLVGYKIHSKLLMVVRRDDDGIRRYVHVATGNYNPSTARFYTDIGMLTCNSDIGDDVTDLFNLLTGISQFRGTKKLLVAPFDLHKTILERIKIETENARQGLPARIIAKMNALVDEQVIKALYEASQAGVPIELIVRGVCCLRPGVQGLSENIRVISIVGRFLEHSRVFYFANGLQQRIYVGSADWMPRNFFRRIEVVFPVEDGALQQRLLDELLAISLADNVKSRELTSSGSYVRRTPQPGEQTVKCQQAFMDLSLKAKKNKNSVNNSSSNQPSAYAKVSVKKSPDSNA